MQEFRVHIQANGRLVIPVQCRRALQLDLGDEVIIRVDDGEATLFSLKHALNRAREKVKKYVGAKKKLSQELIDLRRKEAKGEE